MESKGKQPSLNNLTKQNFGVLKKKQNETIQAITKPHVESFNYMLGHGLTTLVKNIDPVLFNMPNGDKVELKITAASIWKPEVASGNLFANTLQVYPTECRERGCSYKGKMRAEIVWRINDKVTGSFDKVLGEIPIMVKSEACNLYGMSPSQLVQHKEEAENAKHFSSKRFICCMQEKDIVDEFCRAREMGGYFIVNGIERIVRMLIMPRRNYPLAINRSNWTKRGTNFTEYGVQMRCVAEDETSVNNVLHYLTDGTARLSFTLKKEQFFIPVVMVMKALIDEPDHVIYHQLILGREENSFYTGCMEAMLRNVNKEDLFTQADCLARIGGHFRVKLQLPEWYTDIEVGQYLLRKCVCIHLKDNMDKFHTLALMTQKLFAFAKGECAAESADNPMFQELLMGGHLFLMVLKEKIEMWLNSLKSGMIRKATQPKYVNSVVNGTYINDATRYCTDVTRALEYLISTGNLVSSTGLGLMQTAGLTVVADKLNYFRYISHFRCVHRGAFFATMRTTAVRKFLPEAWGFLCPVHTPDGAPCGLMNHMTASCQAVNVKYPTDKLVPLLIELGMTSRDDTPTKPYKKCYRVILDGRMVGWLEKNKAEHVCDQLRTYKVQCKREVPSLMEIALIPITTVASLYPGLYLFTTIARMIRPVKNLALNSVEMIGTFEQVFLNICLTLNEAYEGITTHQEMKETEILSVIASLTPFSDFNQSPRNMYQCQMGKQTMGTPLHAWNHRTDNKLYRLNTPQSPLVRPQVYDEYDMDSYAIGTNAVVAVISYTGYDMEDAMVLNKASFERGFGHGSVYKHEFINLRVISGDRFGKTLIFGCPAGTTEGEGHLDRDGLPPIGAHLTEGTPYYSYVNVQTSEVKVIRYKSSEPAIVHNVRICGNDLGTADLQQVSISLIMQRNPQIGDKFSSRHGQKGICSQKWPTENMPFSESGMSPDIIFNPHGFPSRMTIGMLIESMAGKSAACSGVAYDATPFTFSEDNPAIDYFGKKLVEVGFNYYGTERMYNGMNGREFEVDIFQGLVYYQRLRHMVSDKFQVRTTGPIDNLTHQPVKGRKRCGGIRFGEMERDGLLSHGTAFLLQDRLMHCSDKCYAYMCTRCEELLSVSREKPASAFAAVSYERKPRWICSLCKSGTDVRLITIPYVFRYLVAELAAMNIKVNLKAADVCCE